MSENITLIDRTTLTYRPFNHLYNRIISNAVGLWNDNLDAERQGDGLDRVERQLTQIDQQYPVLVDRAALLGPELGGTVVMEEQR